MRRRGGRGPAGEGSRAVKQELRERDGGRGRGRGAGGGRVGFEVGGLGVGGDLDVGRLRLAWLGGRAGLVGGLDLGGVGS